MRSLPTFGQHKGRFQQGAVNQVRNEMKQGGDASSCSDSMVQFNLKETASSRLRPGEAEKRKVSVVGSPLF